MRALERGAVAEKRENKGVRHQWRWGQSQRKSGEKQEGMGRERCRGKDIDGTKCEREMYSD